MDGDLTRASMSPVTQSRPLACYRPLSCYRVPRGAIGWSTTGGDEIFLQFPAPKIFTTRVATRRGSLYSHNNDAFKISALNKQ
jgi:hypothetical protein